MTERFVSRMDLLKVDSRHTVQSNNAEDEDNRQCHDNDRVDLEAGRLIGVQP